MRRTALASLSYLLWLALFVVLGTIPAARGDLTVGSNFWFSYRGDSYTDPFTSSANFAAYPNHGDVWRPEFIAEMTPYKQLRFMDWGCTNNQTVINWSDRKLPTASNQEGVWNGNIEYTWNGSAWVKVTNPGQSARGIAYEYMIELCNRLNKDIWICVPHKASDDYVTQLANLLKTKVNSNLKIYVEYSNEVWNSSFDQEHWCEDQGIAQGLDTDRYTAGQKYYGKRVGQIMAIFYTQFSGQTSRLVRIQGSQPGETWHAGNAYSQIIAAGGGVDALAIAPYFGRDLYGNDSSLFTKLYTSIDSKVTNSAIPSKNFATGKGLRLFAYEGGQHIYLGSSDVANRDSRMYDVYQYYFNQMNPYFEIFNHYAHASTYNNTTGWGAKEGIGQAESSAHKYRSLKDWVNAHPAQQVAAPSFGPAAGTYSSAQNVTISTSTSGASIRYTTDGSTPTSTSGTLYSNPVSIASTTTLKAIAYKSGMTDSTVTSGTYTISGGGGGTFTLNPTADMASQGDTSGTNASPPVSLYANLYMKFSLSSVTGTPVSNAKVRVYRNETSQGALTVSVYQCTSDSWSEGGTLPAMGSLITTSASNNSVGYIDLDVTSFVANEYAGDKTVTLVLTTSSSGWTNFNSRESASNKPQLVVTTAMQQVAAPTFSPGAGTYTSAQNVTISSTTSGASIRYTLDGSTPTSTSGTVYSGPVNISSTKTLKAIAYKSGMTDSAVTSGTYTINLGGTFTLNPTADMSSQGDTSGTNATPPVSQWANLYFKFSLSSVTGSTVSNAKLRVYRTETSQGALTVSVYQCTSDSWSEGGTLPSMGSLITTSASNNSVGYIDLDVTSFVNGEFAGDKTVTLVITTSAGGWSNFTARESASNKPQLVVKTN